MRYLFAVIIGLWANLSFAQSDCGQRLGLLQGPGTMKSQAINHDGRSRSYNFFIPRGVPDSSPVIVLLHPLGSSGLAFSNYVGVPDAGHASCAIVISPNGLSGSWNAGNVNVASTADDVSFVMAVIADFKNRNPGKADSDRQYLMGMSNGGSMAYRLACEKSRHFAAVVAVAATMTRDPRGRSHDEEGFDPAFHCDDGVDGLKPAHPMPLLVIHGRADSCVAFDGGSLSLNRDNLTPSISKIVQEWSGMNGCPTTDISTGQETLQVQTSAPNLGIASCKTITGCSNGSMVQMCDIERGGHRWHGANPLTSFITCAGDGGIANKRDFFATDEAFKFLLDNNFRLSGLSSVPL